MAKRNKELHEENLRLSSRIEELTHSLLIQKEAIKDLEEKNKLLKIANSMAADPEEKKLLKLKINEFIREIDKSLLLLNN